MVHEPTLGSPPPPHSPPSPPPPPPPLLPPALLVQVFHNLSTADLFCASQVSRGWRHTVFLSKPFSPTLLRPHLSVLRGHFGQDVVPHRIPIPTVEKLLTRFVRETDPALFTTTTTYHLPTTTTAITSAKATATATMGAGARAGVRAKGSSSSSSSSSSPLTTAACRSHLCVSQAKKTHVYACTSTPLTHVLSIPTPRAHALSLTGAYLATTTSCGRTTLRVLEPLLKLYSITVPDTLDVCLLPHTPSEEPLLAILSRSGLTLVHPEYSMFSIREKQLRGKRTNPWVVHIPAEIPSAGGGGGGGDGSRLVATGDGRGLVVCGTHYLGTFVSLQDTKQDISTSSLWKHYTAVPRTLASLPGTSMSHLRGDTFVGRSSGVLALVSIDPAATTTRAFFPVPEGATALACGAHAIAVVTPRKLSIVSTATGHERTVHRVAGGEEVKAVHADERKVTLVMKDRIIVVSLWGGKNGEWNLDHDGFVGEGAAGAGPGIGCCVVM